MHLEAYENHLSGVQIIATINLQCNSLFQIHSSVYLRLKINSMTDRACMGEVMTQVWLKSVNK